VPALSKGTMVQAVTVSPLSIKSQLNWSPRIAIHFMLWFDGIKHLDVGYLSNNPTVVKAQIEFLHQRGVDLLIMDYYGPQNVFQESVVSLIKAECERRGDMKFAFGFDHGALKYKTSGVSDTDWMLSVVKTAIANHMGSPAYEKLPDGRFLAHEFGWETVSGLDISKITTTYKSNVAFFFRNSGGWTKPGAAGAYGWEDNKDVPGYTANFIKVAQSHPTGTWFGSISKGFDDHNRQPGADPTKSVWDSTAPARIYPENNGQTWLNNIAAYNAAAIKPQYLQIVTFNDHEEGTAVEFGIDSDAAVTISRTGDKIKLVFSGNLATMNSAEIYIDGLLYGLVVDLTAPYEWQLPTVVSGDHTIQARFVGLPFFKNKDSNSVTAKAVLVPDQTISVPVDTVVTVQIPVKQMVDVVVSKKVVWV
jgi:hypothetical protein